MVKEKSDATDKKETPINENKENKTEDKKSSAFETAIAKFLGFIFTLIIIGSAFAAALVYYRDVILPAQMNAAASQPIVSTPQPAAEPTPSTVPTPPEKITEIKYVIPESVSNAINELRDKVGKIENLTNQYMNIKADSSALISLGERVDTIDKRTQRLNQLSNDGALILTAALMIKENAAAGLPVRFEAEILRQLAASQPDIATSIEYIYNNSARQYPSDKNLVKKFNQITQTAIYNAKHQGTWKDRLLRKINEYVQISGPDINNPVNREILTLTKIQGYVDDNQSALAVEMLSKPENSYLLNNKELEDWYAITDSKLKFNRALSEICAYSLALMKTESLQNVTLP